jgi:hypothetical protein
MLTDAHIYRVEDRVMAVFNAFQKKTLGTGKQSREVQLTRLMLTAYSAQPTLPVIKSFWLENFQRRTCFFDLRRMVAQLRPEKLKEFHKFIGENARSRTPDNPSQVCPQERTFVTFCSHG